MSTLDDSAMCSAETHRAALMASVGWYAPIVNSSVEAENLQHGYDGYLWLSGHRPLVVGW